MACDPLCIGSIPQKYDAGGCEFKPRKFGSSTFGAIKCTVDFADILDTSTPSTWESAIAADDIVLGPKFGNFTIGDTTTSVIISIRFPNNYTRSSSDYLHLLVVHHIPAKRP